MKRRLSAQIVRNAVLPAALIVGAAALLLPDNLRPLLPAGTPDPAIWRVIAAVGAAVFLAALATLALDLTTAAAALESLEAMRQAMAEITAGGPARRIGARSSDEIGALVRTFNAMSLALDRQTERFRESETTLRAALANMADGVIVLDTFGLVLFFNRVAEATFGRSSDQAYGRTLLDIALHPELDGLVSEALRTRRPGAAEVHLRRPAPRILQTYVTPVPDEEPSPIGAVLVFQDLTEIRRLEKVRRDFVTNASHELRTPLATIQVMVDTLRSSLADDPQAAERFLGTIGREVQRMATLVDDLLELSRTESGPAALDWMAVALDELLRSVADTFAPVAERRGQTLTARLEGPAMAWCDPEAVVRMASNLIENAAKYSPEGGTIEVGCARSGGEVRFWVEDNGIGIPFAEQTRIFERFYRVDRARSRATGGTGLGLSIVKHLAEAHDGRVEVRSTPGEGSRFTVCLPAFDEAEATPGPAA